MEIVERVELLKFDNNIGMEIGLAIIKQAQSLDQKIAVEVCRLNQPIFLFISEGLPADKHNWLRRKANVAQHFEESSLKVKNDLAEHNMSLDKTFALSEEDFLAKGGSIPIFVNNAGMVATITVSGLTDIEDHNIILEVLNNNVGQ